MKGSSQTLMLEKNENCYKPRTTQAPTDWLSPSLFCPTKSWLTMCLSHGQTHTHKKIYRQRRGCQWKFGGKEKRGSGGRKKGLLAETWYRQASSVSQSAKCILGLNIGSCWRVWAGCGSEVIVWVWGGVVGGGKDGWRVSSEPTSLWSWSQRERDITACVLQIT